MRHDLFVKNTGPVSTWRPYAMAVTPTNSKHICARLESLGNQVLICRHAKTMGKFVYQTAI